MRIELYTIAWNEMRMLPFFLDYHLPWVDRIVVYDDGSDDGTREFLAAQQKVELRDFPPKGDSFVKTALSLWNEAWKESRGRADWVAPSNIDECIWHRDAMAAYLAECDRQGATLIHPRGYEMVAERFPAAGQGLPDAAPRGVPVFGHDKMQVFKPGPITEMRYAPGRHWSGPIGECVVAAAVEAKLLHYKYVDYEDYHLPRQEALGARLLAGDLADAMRAQYRISRAVRKRYFDWLSLHATDVVGD